MNRPVGAGVVLGVVLAVVVWIVVERLNARRETQDHVHQTSAVEAHGLSQSPSSHDVAAVKTDHRTREPDQPLTMAETTYAEREPVASLPSDESCAVSVATPMAMNNPIALGPETGRVSRRDDVSGDHATEPKGQRVFKVKSASSRGQSHEASDLKAPVPIASEAGHNVDMDRSRANPLRRMIKTELPPVPAETESNRPPRTGNMPKEPINVTSDLGEEVRAFRKSFFTEEMDDQKRRVWAGRLIELADHNPDDPWAPEALLAVGSLAFTNDPVFQEQLLRRCLVHPKVSPTTQIMALLDLPRLAWFRDDLFQAFQDLELKAEIIVNLEPGEVRDSWLPELYRIPLEKAHLLKLSMYRHREEDGWTPLLPEKEAGMQLSDYYQEFLDNTPTEILKARRSIYPSMADILKEQAEAFIMEGDRQRAIENYRKILELPDKTYPRTQVLFWEAQARYPDGGPEYRRLLETIERNEPSDGWSPSLSNIINHCYFEENIGRGYIERVEPQLLSEDPAIRARLDRFPTNRPAMMMKLAKAYTFPDVEDYRRAIEYAEHFVSDYPDDPGVPLAYLWLAEWYTKIGEYERAMDYCDRLLDEFPDSSMAEKTKELRKRALMRLEQGAIDENNNKHNQENDD